MIRLLFIVPYPELKGTVEYIYANHPEKDLMDCDIFVSFVEDLPEIHTEDYDAVIARGYTAQRIAELYPRLPLVQLAVSGYDIVRAILDCCKAYHPNKLAVFSSESHVYEVKDICQVFGVEAEIYSRVKKQELQTYIQKAMSSGCDALIGGYSASLTARQLGLQTTTIQTGKDTVFHAFNTALRTAQQIQNERIVAQMQQTVISTSKDGLLYVDALGTIQVCNQVIHQMSGKQSLTGRKLKEALPYLSDLFQAVTQDGQKETDKVFTIPGSKVTVSTSCTAVMVDQQVCGAVINLTDISVIQNLEGQIRRKLNERGLRAKYTFSDIIHNSGVIEKTICRAMGYAASDSNIIIVGETGTGKELFAQSIHNASQRKNGPFVAINCAALPENLLESELFGYVEGAFTGSSKGGKKGLFEQAHGGTLFLDEIAEISPSTQSKLLRVLQERQVRRIGDNKVLDVDVRIISATNKSLARMTERGEFRWDLMYRLDVLRLFIPPLRERENDVELLFLHLLKRQHQKEHTVVPVLAEDAVPLLHTYPFIGNIRELENIVERVSVLRMQNAETDGGENTHGELLITKSLLFEALYPQDLEDEWAANAATSMNSELSEQDRLLQALERCGGNRTQAAKLLGMDRSTLWRKLQKYQPPGK